MKITLCASTKFYKHVNEIADELEAMGHEAFPPVTAQKMRETGNYDDAAYRTYDSEDAIARKKRLMDTHFDLIAEGDAVLIVNDEKHGIAGYIGPNVTLELAIAYYLEKKIFVLNQVDQERGLYLELAGLGAVFIDGDVSKIK